MRARLASTLRRLDRVETQLVAEDGSARGGVLLVPRIPSLDEWEAVAVPMLAKLAAAAAEDVASRHADESHFVHPMPAPVVNGQRTHQPDPHRAQEARPMPPRPPMGLTR